MCSVNSVCVFFIFVCLLMMYIFGVGNLCVGLYCLSVYFRNVLYSFSITWIFASRNRFFNNYFMYEFCIFF